ncbi:putative membrane protein SirB2 [Natronocella acetinitrilica]|uniref:Membrane protein SirB2 n=1 Tax=Natronocella acetinitrilica TaxID=414046 RepID=A0AAE3KBS8_9GAMM|nr:SirB2 family protein [Natronocella acetinitrilica]MCP1674961.1 putative membrane protein SirB2 [Natronocella acetinitrilica]
MDYIVVKHLHSTMALLTISLFLLRGVWMIAWPGMLQRRWVRIVPHVIDTVLLASAITMLVMISLNPLTQGWLMVKILGLVAYIVLGTIALRRGRTKPARIAAFVGALLVFFYIYAVAFSKQPWPF